MKNFYVVETVLLIVLLTPSFYCSPTIENKSILQHRKIHLNRKEKDEGGVSNRLANSDGNYKHLKHIHAFWHLRNKVDKLNLKQKIDRILIQNLQKNVKNIEKLYESSKIFQKENELSAENMENVSPSISKVNQAQILENDIFMNFKNSEKRSKILPTEAFQFDFDLLGNEILEKIDLRIKKVVKEEMKNMRTKMSEMERCCKKCDVAMQHNAREKSTVQWMLQIVPSLQKSVTELQESTNVVQALHDKQDLDSRLKAVGRDVMALQKDRSTLASEVESVIAATDTLTGEMKEATKRIQKVEGSLIQVKEQLDEQRTASDDLLKALPDGFLADPRRRGRDDREINRWHSGNVVLTTEGIAKENHLPTTNIQGELDARMEKLELRTASLDFALMNLQKRVFFETVENISRNSTPSLPETAKLELGHIDQETGLSKRLDEIEFELSKLKDSSESVLRALSSVDKHNGDSLKQINQKLSKVEVQIDREREERQSKNVETRTNFIETEREVRDDYVELKNDVTFLKKQLITLEDQTQHLNKVFLHNSSSSSSATIQHLILNDDPSLKSKISEVCLETVKTENGRNEERLSKLENVYYDIKYSVKKNSKALQKRTRHRHGRYK